MVFHAVFINDLFRLAASLKKRLLEITSVSRTAHGESVEPLWLLSDELGPITTLQRPSVTVSRQRLFDGRCHLRRIRGNSRLKRVIDVTIRTD